MHPYIYAALVRAQADEIADRAARKPRRAELSERLAPSARHVEEHAYTLPRVIELRPPADPGNYDPSVW